LQARGSASKHYCIPRRQNNICEIHPLFGSARSGRPAVWDYFNIILITVTIPPSE